MGKVLLHSGDSLSEEHLQTLFARDGIADYVQSGLDVTVDYGAAVADLTAGLVHLVDNDRGITAVADAVSGVELASGGTNYVHLRVIETTDAEGNPDHTEDYYVAQEANAPPPEPSLVVAEIDMGAQAIEERYRHPPLTNAESYKQNDIDADADGVVNRADVADEVAGGDVTGTLDIPNTFYDEGGDGAVDEAEHAASADSATTADSAGSVPAEGVGGQLDNRNAMYDSDDNGVVDFAEVADRAEAADAVAAGDVNGTLDNLNQRYDSDGNGTVDEAEVAQSVAGSGALDHRSLAENIGEVVFPGVELGGSSPDNTVTQVRICEDGWRMYLARAHVTGLNGGGFSGVDLEVTNERTGDTFVFDQRFNKGAMYSFPEGAITFTLVNKTGGTQRADASVRYFFEQE